MGPRLRFLTLGPCASNNAADLSLCISQILKDATEFFSRATPNLATVIPAMDHIDTHFTNAIKPDSKLNSAIRAAVGLGKKTLNRYYSRTDEVEVYRIAMSTILFFSCSLTVSY